MAKGSVSPFKAVQGGTVAVSASVTSASATITPDDSVLVYNPTAVTAFVRIGSGPATSADIPVPAGAQMLLDCGPYVTTIAVVLASSTGTIYLTPGAGTQR